MTEWATADARRALARKQAIDALGPLGVCPNCGAEPDVELIDVSTLGPDGAAFIAGEITCSARCYERDPAAYLAAVERGENPLLVMLQPAGGNGGFGVMARWVASGPPAPIITKRFPTPEELPERMWEANHMRCFDCPVQQYDSEGVERHAAFHVVATGHRVLANGLVWEREPVVQDVIDR